MTNTLLKRQTSWYVLALVVVACCGCQSMKGTTDKWSTAWKEKSKPKPAEPNQEETVTYWGQKKKQPKQVEMPAELKEKLAQRSEATDRSRSFADNYKQGNQLLRENRLEEARRAYELALAAKPDDPDVHHRLAVVADKQKLFGVADDHYEAALRQRQRDPDLLSDFGYSHSLRGNDSQAEQILQQALTIDPSHTGAMANLGAIYSRQGRYDEAFAMFRHGATEAEAQQYIAQLFPKGRPLGASPAGTALAQNPAATGQRAALPMPGDNRPDLGNMTIEQVKAEMERKRLESIQKRQQQQLAEISPPRDWSTDQGASAQTQNPAGGTQPWMWGPPNGSGVAMTPAQNPVQVVPPSSNPSSNPGQNGFAASPPGSLTAPAGTNPQGNMEFWQGAPVQQQPPGNVAAAPQGQATPNINPWGPPPSGTAAPTLDLSRLAGSLQQSGEIAQAGYQPEPSSAGGSSASQAAAQLGMSAGPGSLFPVMAGDSAAPNSATPLQAPTFVPRFGTEFSPTPQYQHPANLQTPAFAPRFGGEFAPPPQYQTPSNQFAPHGVNRPVDSRFSASSGSAWSNSSMPAQSTAPQNSWGNETSMTPSIAPASPASNWARPTEGPLNWQQPTNSSPVVQAIGTPAPWGQPARSTDALETFQSEMNAGANVRAAASAWGNSSGPSSGSRPYSGNWPNNSSGSGAAPASGTSSSNAIPAWNGGSAANGAGQNSSGSSGSGAANDSLPQWPYAPQR